MAASYSGLGIVYNSLGKYQEAIEMHKKSLAIKTGILGGDSHLDVAMSLMNVGNVLKAMGKYEEVLVQHRKFLGIQIRVVGDHLDVAKSDGNIGSCTAHKASTRRRSKATRNRSKSFSCSFVWCRQPPARSRQLDEHRCRVW